MAAKKSAPQSQARTAPRQPARDIPSMEKVRRLAPHTALAEKISTTFGLDLPDCEGIADKTEEAIGTAARALEGNLNERAMKIHLERIVGSYVGSAYRAAQFYSDKVSGARSLTASNANESRDEDRGGPVGFESKAERARAFAATVGLQAHALMAAAEGAVSAYAQVIGEEWQPFQAGDAPAPVTRRAASEEMNAFEG